MWHEGTVVHNVDAPDAIDSLGNIKADRFRSPCALCGKVRGRRPTHSKARSCVCYKGAAQQLCPDSM